MYLLCLFHIQALYQYSFLEPSVVIRVMQWKRHFTFAETSFLGYWISGNKTAN